MLSPRLWMSVFIKNLRNKVDIVERYTCVGNKVPHKIDTISKICVLILILFNLLEISLSREESSR